MLFAILVSSVILATEFPTNEDKARIYAIAELMLTLIFTVELIVKLIALGLKYFSSGWNWLDMLIVIVSWSAIILQVRNRPSSL